MITISNFDFNNDRFIKLQSRQQQFPPEAMRAVADILEDVRLHGDAALNKYMMKFDQVDLNKIGFKVSEVEFREARKNVPPEFKKALELACNNLIKFHKNQVPRDYTEHYDDQVVLERHYTPLQKVAVTTPGEMAPLSSSLYMNLVPAIVAKVPDIFVISKPKNGKISDHLLYAADYLNIKNVYKISGPQGIAALAYGTASVDKVDAICGPGNMYTQMAKKLLYGTVRIDSIAGPSEIVIIADEYANPRYVAADLLSQAEHGTGFEASIAFCLSRKFAEEIKGQLNQLARQHNLSSVEKALGAYGNIFIVDSITTAIAATNRIAPEHVEILTQDHAAVLAGITHAGSVFVGAFSPEPVGDYFCGTNHVLPTCGTARFSSGLSVPDFMRGYSVIRYSPEALRKNGEHIKNLAAPEGMQAHQLSVSVRLDEQAII
jgi:histidinol dehydrogenase